MSEEERYRINAFDWETAFPEIMQGGGFDAVIGNPPWVLAGYYLTLPELRYLQRRFETSRGKFDLYYVFVELGCRILRPSGFLGMILPNKLFHTAAASRLRDQLVRERWIRRVVDFGESQVFGRATNYSCILLLAKETGPGPTYGKARPGLEIAEEFRVA